MLAPLEFKSACRVPALHLAKGRQLVPCISVSACVSIVLATCPNQVSPPSKVCLLGFHFLKTRASVHLGSDTVLFCTKYSPWALQTFCFIMFGIMFVKPFVAGKVLMPSAHILSFSCFSLVLHMCHHFLQCSNRLQYSNFILICNLWKFV